MLCSLKYVKCCVMLLCNLIINNYCTFHKCNVVASSRATERWEGHRVPKRRALWLCSSCVLDVWLVFTIIQETFRFPLNSHLWALHNYRTVLCANRIVYPLHLVHSCYCPVQIYRTSPLSHSANCFRLQSCANCVDCILQILYIVYLI